MNYTKSLPTRPVLATPWGASQTIRNHAEGIDFISTAGHGGFRLSPEKQAEVKAKFPNFTPWVAPEATGTGWYEEDADSAVIVAAFPNLFSETAVSNAIACIRGNHKYYKIEL